MAIIQLKSGATRADIQAAIDSAPSGTTIVLPAGETIGVSSAISIDVSRRDITLDLNGSTLKQEGNANVISAFGTHDGIQKVALGSANGNATVTFSSMPGGGVKAGDWIKIIADDRLPGGKHTSTNDVRLGEAMEVQSVSGNTVTFKGMLHDQSLYKTNVRASTYDSGDLVIKNGRVLGDQGNASWKKTLLSVKTTVDTKVENVTVENGNSMGLDFRDTVNGHAINIVAKNLKNDTANGYYGYGVHSGSSKGTTVDGLYAEKIRHATDSNANTVSANSSEITKYGGDLEMVVKNSVAYNTLSSAWSWHSESNWSRYENVMAFDSPQFAVIRGVHNDMINAYAVNNGRGVQLYEYGDNDARDLLFQNMYMKEIGEKAFFQSNGPSQVMVKDSFIETSGQATSVGGGVQFVNTQFVKSDGNERDSFSGGSGADVLLGGKDADTLSGGGGDDYLWGGPAVDSLTGGAGSDRFAWHQMSEAGDTVTDFQAGAGGDIVDLSVMAARSGWRSANPLQSGHVRVQQSGSDALLQVDNDGGGNGFQTLATLKGVSAAAMTGANFKFLIAGGTLGGGTIPTDPGPAPNPVPQLPPVNSEIKVEAETLAMSGYVTEADKAASAGNLIKLSGSAGTATHTFAGAAGAYKVVLGYKDEFDGVGKLIAKLNGGTLESWSLDTANISGHYVSKERVLTEGMALQSGDKLSIDGVKGGEEYGRVDYIRYIPVAAPVEQRPQPDATDPGPAPQPGTGTPPPAAIAITVEAESFALAGYVREADKAASSGNLIKVAAASGIASLASTAAASDPVGTASTAFNGTAGAYKVVLGYKDEFDGVGKLAAKLNGGELDSWSLDAAVPAGSHYVSRERVLTEGMELRQGDTLAIEGLKGGEEYARVDYVKFIPVAAAVEPRPGAGPAPLPTNPLPTDPLPTDPLPTDPDPVDPVALPAATKVGTAADDRLSGTSGADVIDGKGGADDMAGGYGDDSYIVDHAGDRIEEWNSSGKGGFDTVYALADHTLGSYVEKLVLAGADDIDGTGGGRNNTFVAGAGKNALTGGGGNDLFVFAKGHLQGDAITDFVGNGAASGDQLRFEGFGPGAALSNQGDVWTVTHAGGSESFQLAGVTALDKADYLFA